MLGVFYSQGHVQVLYAECRYAECRYSECNYAECRYAECHYAESHYAECRGTVWLMLNGTRYAPHLG